MLSSMCTTCAPQARSDGHNNISRSQISDLGHVADCALHGVALRGPWVSSCMQSAFDNAYLNTNCILQLPQYLYDTGMSTKACKSAILHPCKRVSKIQLDCNRSRKLLHEARLLRQTILLLFLFISGESII